MTVYIDLLFGLNAIINYLLLRGSAAIGGFPVKLWRLTGAGILGGLYAVAVVLPGMEFLQGWVWQALFLALMVLAAFGWKRAAVKQGLFFLALSFAFGGAVLLLIQAVEPDCVLLGGRAYYAVTMPALLLLAGVCYGLAALVLNGWGTHTGGDLIKLEIALGERSASVTALRDTGNTLRDPITGQPVLVADRKILKQLLPDLPEGQNPSEFVRQVGVRHPELRFRLVPYRAVGTDHGLLPAVRCRVRHGKHWDKTLVAFTAGEVSAGGQFDALTGGGII